MISPAGSIDTPRFDLPFNNRFHKDNESYFLSAEGSSQRYDKVLI